MPSDAPEASEASEASEKSRRQILKMAVLGLCGVVPVGDVLLSATAVAETKTTNMPPDHLINALRSIGKPVCVAAADRLAMSTNNHPEFDLHLRGAELNDTDAQVLAVGIQRSGSGLSLKSFSASDNPDLGDVGVAALAEVFPDAMTDLGLVGCSIGDAGGQAILDWARSAPKLQMLCVERNRFSANMRSDFQEFASSERQILVVI